MMRGGAHHYASFFFALEAQLDDERRFAEPEVAGSSPAKGAKFGGSSVTIPQSDKPP